MDGGDRRAELLVREGEEPSDADGGPVVEGGRGADDVVSGADGRFGAVDVGRGDDGADDKGDGGSDSDAIA